jgi:hypothetical protein
MVAKMACFRRAERVEKSVEKKWKRWSNFSEGKTTNELWKKLRLFREFSTGQTSKFCLAMAV